MTWPSPESLPDLSTKYTQRYYVLKQKYDERRKGYALYEVRPMPVIKDDCYTVIQENMGFKAASALQKELETENGLA